MTTDNSKAGNIFIQTGLPSLAATPTVDVPSAYDPQKASNVFADPIGFNASPEPFTLNPVVRKERSTKQIEELVEMQRKAADASWNRSARAANAMNGMIDKFAIKPSPLVKYDVPDAAIYNKLNSGKLIPKFKNYIYGTDNENRMYNESSTGERWINGIEKFTAKTLINTAGGITGFVYGLPLAIAEGNFHAVYDNKPGSTH
jgi:hypothetical protein